ncbi:MAG: cytidine deaminase [Candidatus Coatesbacteria bacterium]|nr:MAG: cytidine deaminase [Candidatus Coatesbacteria bacterium]RLC44801.1 MAG: cytidine deaminase [Candidatus Coatesbacteria bacterium]
MKRPTFDEYFIGIAKLVATRSTCLRRKVGCVLVKNNRILATGYNGAPSGLPHCDEVGCIRETLGIEGGQRHEMCRGLHAEQNAIIQAALHGVSIKDAEIYCTHHPCSVCAKMLINAHILRVKILEDYPDTMAKRLFEEAGVELIVLE